MRKEGIKELMNYYIKKAIPVRAKVFAPGDEDGYDMDQSEDEYNEYDLKDRMIPYIHTLEGKILYGGFGEHYVIYGNHGDKWLVEKKIFEDTYELVSQPYTT